jgi:predicted nucleic acid-binding Zn ribbon protein
MTKDLSRRSSAASSAHLRSPEGNGPDAPAQDAEQAGEGHCSVRRSPSVTVDLGKGAEMDVLDSRTGGSQNMTASNSGPSNPLANDGTGNGVTATAPYGTRSRNRTGTSRPNYAEDKELDGEYEIVASMKETNARKAPRGVDAPGLDTRQAANASRKVESDPELSIVQNHYKGPIPGTSTFSANPTTATASTNQPSKKRKAPGSSTTSAIVSQAQPLEQAAPPDPAVTRRASIAAQVMRGFRDSNMLSFDDCGGRLKGKRLMADDGTVLEVNGKI